MQRVLIHKGMMAGALVSLAAGCVFADTAKIEAFVIDEATEEPLANVEVTGTFDMHYDISISH